MDNAVIFCQYDAKRRVQYPRRHFDDTSEMDEPGDEHPEVGT